MSDTRAWSSELSRVLRAVLLIAVAAIAGEAGAQDNLFRDSTDERTIHNQVQLALAPLERGYELLAASRSPAETDVAVQSLKTAYKYLRAAQEGSQRVASQAKFPDPMLKIRMDRIWAVRSRLLNCIDNQPHLDDDDGRTREWCLGQLPEAIRRLRVLTVALP
jgi:hypothetical protein